MSADTFQAFAGPDQMNHVSELMQEAPRLSLALLKGPVGSHEAFRTALDKSGKKLTLTGGGFDGELTELLTHVDERLKQGLVEAWAAPDTYDLRRPAGAVMTPDEMVNLFTVIAYFNSPEETWARAFSEMVVFSMYGGIAQTYLNSGNDKLFFEAFPRVYPIAIACQHLSSLCILSRGHPLSGLTSGPFVGCSCTGGTTLYPIFEKKATFELGTSSYTMITELMKIPLAPGDIVVFNPGGPKTVKQDHGSTTHVGSVLRTSGNRIQFIDTGVLGGDKQSVVEGGTVDHSFRSGTIAVSDSMIGWAKIPAASDLQGWAAKVAAARPLGVARLVLLDVSDSSHPEVRYVSKLIHMRYPVSRLLWSMRGLPIQDLAAIWYVYVPKFAWAKALLNASEPPAPPSSLFTADGELYLANVIRGEASGEAHVYRNRGDIFFLDFSLSKLTDAPEMARGVLLALPATPKLSNWCMSPKNMGKRYIRKPGEKEGTVDEGASGVAHFDP